MAFKFPKPGQESMDAGSVSELDRCREESRNCQFCQGNGYATVFHRDWNGSKIGVYTWTEWEYDEDGKAVEVERHQRFVAETSAHCTCSLGRLIRSAQVAANHPHARIVDGADVLAGRGPWLFDPPGPDVPQMPARQGESFSSRVARLVSRKHVPPRPRPLTPADVERQIREARRADALA